VRTPHPGASPALPAREVSVPAPVLHGKSLLIFDFDGTVADTTPLHAAAFAAVLAPLGVEVDYARVAGMRTAEAVRACTLAAGLDLDAPTLAALSAAKQAHVRERLATDLAPMPGVDAFLRAARGRLPLALASSGSRATVERALAALGYTGWFAPVLCSEDVRHAKPHPEIFLSVLERTGCAAAQALVFEDAEAGFAAARAAGIAYVDVRPNPWDQLLPHLHALASPARAPTSPPSPTGAAPETLP
jgi:sugar-phosphatase